MHIHTVHCGYFKLDGGAMFGVVPKALWSRAIKADENNRCTWAMRSILIEEGDRRILVDTGLGDKQDAKFFSHVEPHGPTMEDSLRALGFSSDDITDVFLTHLHFDHCGGCIRRQDDQLVPVFKNATFWSNARHWEWAVHPNAREKASFLKENIQPIEDSGRLRFIATREGIAFSEHLSIRFCSGHTEAMMLPQIRYKGHTLVFMADLLPSIHHIPIPWVMAYDMFPMQSLTEKTAFLNEALEKDYILYFEHDAEVECCRLQQTEKGIRPAETFALADI